MIRKTHLDLDVALETGFSQKKVKLVTALFLHKVMRALIEGQEVHLDRFGQFRLVEQGGAPPPHARFGSGEKTTETGTRFRVHFKKAQHFTKEVRRHAKENTHGKVRRRRER